MTDPAPHGHLRLDELLLGAAIVVMCCVAYWFAERLAEGRGSTAENNRLSKPFPMPREPRYLQRLVLPSSVVR